MGCRTAHLWVILLAVAVVLVGCSSDSVPDPRKTVISLFGAMERNDQAELTYLLDLPELMQNIGEDYALKTDTARVIHNPEEILSDLTGDGRTKRAWFRMQRIIGAAELTSESTATVEVTFVDKQASRAYLTRFGLHLVNGKWRIYSFKTVSERP